jgi:uncharacterized protein (DUF2235 family)
VSARNNAGDCFAAEGSHAMPEPYVSLVLCFDGTWNTWKSHTNVSRVYSQIADISTGCLRQRKFYDEGVGTAWYDRIRGGVLGAGLDRNIRQGYAWLATMYQCEGKGPSPSTSRAVVPDPTRRRNGDLLATPLPESKLEFLTGSDIYILGFSRGAFTARSLAGLINFLGIPLIDPAAIAADQELADQAQVKDAWDLYATRPTPNERDSVRTGTADSALKDRIAKHNEAATAFRLRPTTCYPVRLHCLGVWDTVGALGIPRVFDYRWIPRFSTKYQFHDTTLGEAVRNAYHAVAIDEQRLPYKATLWEKAKSTTERVEQRWFSGAHANVGGGYEDDLLPAPPLEWLATMAAGCGLEFYNDRRIDQPDHTVPASIPMAPAIFDLDGTEFLSPVRDSYAEFLRGGYRLLRSLPGMGGRVYRRMLVDRDGVAQTVDSSAFAKWQADPRYRPPNLGQAGRIDVSFNVATDDDAMPAALPAAPPLGA